MLNDKKRLAVLVAVMLVLGGVLFWMFSKPATYPSQDTGQKVTDQFLKALQLGQAADAWQSTTAEFKSAEGREAFLDFVKKHDFLTKPLEFTSSQLVDIQDQQRSEFVYRVSENKTTVRLVIGREAGTWKVDRLAVH